MYYTLITRLTLDYLTFVPTNIYKHALTYTTFSHVKLFFLKNILQHLQIFFFQIDPSVAMEIR
jgi:hypothetical protein